MQPQFGAVAQKIRFTVFARHFWIAAGATAIHIDVSAALHRPAEAGAVDLTSAARDSNG